MLSVKKCVLAGLLAAAGLLLSADKASAQYSYYNYGVNPYGGGYSNYNYVNPGGVGINPYTGGLYQQPYTAYQTQYFANPFYGVGALNQSYVAPSIYGPGGYNYRFYRFR